MVQMNGPGEGPPRKDGRLVLLQGTAEFMEFLEQYEANHRFYVGAGAIYIRGGKRKPVARLQTGMKVLVGKAGVLVNCKINICCGVSQIFMICNSDARPRRHSPLEGFKLCIHRMHAVR